MAVVEAFVSAETVDAFASGEAFGEAFVAVEAVEAFETEVVEALEVG